jgi:hypothetical protein
MTILGPSGHFAGCYLKISQIAILLTLQRHKPVLCERRVPLREDAKLRNLECRNENKDINFFYLYEPNLNPLELQLSV